MWVCGAGVYQAGISTKMVNISLIYASSPVMIAVCSVLWLREPFSKRQVLGVFIAILGVVHVVVQGEWARLAQVELVPGDLWILAASLAWAAYSLLQKHWRSTLSAGAQLACICAGGVLVMVPFALWEFLQADTPALGHDAFMLIALAALFPGLGAYWLYGWVQKNHRCQPCSDDALSGPFVCQCDGVGSPWRRHWFAPCDGGCTDTLWRWFGDE